MTKDVQSVVRAMTVNEVEQLKKTVEWLGLYIETIDLLKTRQSDLELIDFETPGLEQRLSMLNDMIRNTIPDLDMEYRKQQSKLVRKFNQQQGV